MAYPPCLDCCQRHEGCHDICPAYQQYREIRQRIHEQKTIDTEYEIYVTQAVKRMKGERI